MHVDARHATTATPPATPPPDQPYSPQRCPQSIFALGGTTWFPLMASVLLQSTTADPDAAAGGSQSGSQQAPVASYLLLNACIMWLRWPSVVNTSQPGQVLAAVQPAAQQLLIRVVSRVIVM